MSDTPYTKHLLRLAAASAGAGRLAKPDASATVHNPACGDRVTIDLALTGGRIIALAHDTRACILTQASAAILGAQAAGIGRTDLAGLAESVQAMLRGGPAPMSPFEAYGAFEGVRDIPGRHICVLLPLRAALEAFDVSDLPEPGRQGAKG